MREPNTPLGRVRREKKNRLSVFHTMNSFRPRGPKMSSSCQKSGHNSLWIWYTQWLISTENVEDQKWVEVAVRQQSLCLLLEGRVSRKSRALRKNSRISKHSSVIFRLPEKEKRYQSWLTYWKTNFSFSSRKENLFSTRVCSPCGTKVRNCAAMLSQIREKLNASTDNEQLLGLKRMRKSTHSNPLLRDLAL